MDETAYPITFSVDYPDRDLNRLTTFFRVLTVIPIAIVLSTVASGTWQASYGHRSRRFRTCRDSSTSG
jgi:hypothetical protein